MLVYFTKATCFKHGLPFEYICTNSKCQCYLRLCPKCAQQHQKVVNIEDELIKEKQYRKKIETLIEGIGDKKCQFEPFTLDSVKRSFLGKKNQQYLQVFKMIMKDLKAEQKIVLGQEQKIVFKTNEYIKYIRQVSKRYMRNNYLKLIADDQFREALVNLSSEKGLQRIKSNGFQLTKAREIYLNLIFSVGQYQRNTYLLKLLQIQQQSLLKSKLKACLSRWRVNKPVHINQIKEKPNLNLYERKQNIQKGLQEAQNKDKSWKNLGLIQKPKLLAGKQN